jgi:hypothetical protein
MWTKRLAQLPVVCGRSEPHAEPQAEHRDEQEQDEELDEIE